MTKKKHPNPLPPIERWSINDAGERVPPVLYPEEREGLISSTEMPDDDTVYETRSKED